MALRLKSIVRDIKFACLVACASYLCAALGGVLAIRPQMIWPLWPGCAFIVAILLLSPKRIWPVLLVAGLAGFVAYDLQEGLAIHSIVLLIVADSFEILIAAFGTAYALGSRPKLSNLASLAKYSFFAVIVSPAAAAFLGAAALGGNYLLSWRTDFFTEALALLTVTPAILSWAHAQWTNRALSYYLELVASFTAMIVAGFITFLSPAASASPAALYSLVPLLLWSALRFGLLGASTSLNIVAFFSIWGAVHQRGPFIGGAPPLEDVRTLQLFYLTASTSFMVLAILVEQYQQSLRDSRESEQRFRLVANSAPVMIWMSGVDMFRNYLNKAWLDFRGASLEEEVGDGWMKSVYPEDLERLLDIEGMAMKRREFYQVEYRVQRHDGEYRWVLQSGAPRLNSDLSFAGYIGSAVDITERKLAEENKERFLSVFDYSAVGMALVGNDGCWIRVNRALCEILGYSEQKLLATNFQSLTHPDDLDVDLSYAQKVFTGQLRFYHMEKRYIHKQGHVVWVALTASAVPLASGKVGYGIAQVQDITARKNAEAALRRDQEELHSLAGRLITVQEEERKRIARDLHDDVSQRLAMLCVDLDTLRQSLPGGAEVGELERMRRETGELVVDLRRLSHNEHHPQLALGLQHGVASFCNDFSRQYGIATKLVHEGDVKRIPETLCFTLFRVLQEAMSNVAKHSGADQVTVTLGVHSDQAILRVSDEGRGFEIGSDRGLGLISMRERLRLVGGTMRVNSSPLQGTDVEAVVPLPRSGGALSTSEYCNHS